MEKIFHANNKQRKAEVDAILISEKMDFKSNTVKRDKDIIYWRKSEFIKKI